MSKYFYWKRIIDAYLLRKTSHLNFWHGEPKENSSFKNSSVGPYYMEFYNKANYNGCLDGRGIPMLDYQGRIGKQYNPIAIAQWGLGNYNLWLKKKEDKYFKKFIKCAQWLEDELILNSNNLSVLMHNFDFEYRDTLKKPWYSGLAQGQALSVLIRALKETGDDKYAQACHSIFKSFMVDVKHGGVRFTDENGDAWIEEYIVDPPTHILNGFVWALWGIYDYSIYFSDNLAEDTFKNFSLTIVKNLHTYDLGYWSKYEHSGTLLPMIASPFYHKLHVVQMHVMYLITGEKVYLDYHKKWKKYLSKITFRFFSLIHKIIFKVLYY